LVTLVLLTALTKVGPNLRASLEHATGQHLNDPSKAIDHRNDDDRARKVLESSQSEHNDEKR
ncbi:MAG: hypothetical protein AAGH90_10205, partial [Pseudomonadota bacterium]